MFNSNISNIKAARGYSSQAVKSFQFCDEVEGPQPSAVGRRGPWVKDKTRMASSLRVRQADTIRPRRTIHLLALTGTLMTRICLSPPAGLCSHSLAPLHTPVTGLQPRRAAALAEGTALGNRTRRGRAAGSCRSLPGKTRYLTPGARPLEHLGEGQGWCGCRGQA